MGGDHTSYIPTAGCLECPKSVTVLEVVEWERGYPKTAYRRIMECKPEAIQFGAKTFWLQKDGSAW